MGKRGKNYYLTFHCCLADGRLCSPLHCHVAAWLCLKICDTWRRLDPVKLWWRHWLPLIVKPFELPSYPHSWMMSATCEDVYLNGADLYFPVLSKTCFWTCGVEIINPIVSTVRECNVELKVFPDRRKQALYITMLPDFSPTSTFEPFEFSRHSMRAYVLESNPHSVFSDFLNGKKLMLMVGWPCILV